MLEASTRFEPYPEIDELAHKAERVLSLCNTMVEPSVRPLSRAQLDKIAAAEKRAKERVVTVAK
ncbi:hypothetical protein [uncultured Parolsenella sp.]|uniref:hypothetical protein n=1 Tax=uncultured Parolsenella sp. TaxID=2083008 RepID=UPI0027D95B4E|nr:hypothetical protein [uncultured Parolsenella sp.]